MYLPHLTDSSVPFLLQSLHRCDVSITVKDPSGRFIYVGDRIADAWGHSVAKVLGMTDTEFFQPDEVEALRTAELKTNGLGTLHAAEHRLQLRGGKHEFKVWRMLLQVEDGSTCLFAAWSDVTAQRQSELQLQHALVQLEQQQLALEALRRETQDQSIRDHATGLFQRIHFDDQLRRELDLSAREHREFALVSIAVDPPQNPAHALGTPAYQRVLESLGRLLRSNTRAMDASCRVEEERFAVLLSGVGLATAHARMEGLRRQCATQIVVLEGRDLGFSVSMGVASFPHIAQNEDALVKASVSALHEAQRRGGNQVTLASIRLGSS